MRPLALFLVTLLTFVAQVTSSSPQRHQPLVAVHGASSKLLQSSPLSGRGDVCVAITGGAGQIAYALVPLLMQGLVFGPGRKVRLRLLDIEACAGALEGVAMEIKDCYCDLVTEVVTTSDPEVAFQGADVAVLLGGFPRLPGMERRDLIAKNVPIMAEHGRALAKCAKAGVRVLVVANPACTNCLIASTSAPSIPRCHFSSLARLDQDRLSAMLSEKIQSGNPLQSASKTYAASAGSAAAARAAAEATTTASQHDGDIALHLRQKAHGIDRSPDTTPRRHQRRLVRGVHVWGNHSPTMWPDVSRAEANVDGRWVPVEEALHQHDGGSQNRGQGSGALDADSAWCSWVSQTLVPAVRERGTKVIETRGKSSALSAANAIANHLKDWLSVTTSADVSMGVFSDGNPYGIPAGLVYSFPVECGEGRHRILKGFGPNVAMLEESAQELLEERREAMETLDMLRESELQAHP